MAGLKRPAFFWGRPPADTGHFEYVSVSTTSAARRGADHCALQWLLQTRQRTQSTILAGMTDDLAKRHCKPCEGGTEVLRADQVQSLLPALHADWTLSADGLEISRLCKFPAYSRTLGFANAVAWIAITEGHHPRLVVNYGSCNVSWTTHAINGLSDNDFICAAKVDRLLSDSE